MSSPDTGDGSPYAPHTDEETEAMLDAIGASDVEELFDIPAAVTFDDTFDILARSEAEITHEVRTMLDRNDEFTCLLGRGHYDHFVPAIVDHVADRSEFLTSYTQYQPEASQGYLQALFEYQSLIVELTGLGVANCSLYDAASALGEAATFAARLRHTDGNRVLIPEIIHPGRRSVLESYCAGPGIEVSTYPVDDGTADVDALDTLVDEETLMLYAESPTIRGTIEPELAAIGELAHDHDAAFCVGSDPFALSILEAPGAIGADVVVGDAGVLGLPVSLGMGLGLFATKDEYVRQTPGRLVGTSEDLDGTRAFALTLVTREQHIRRERATSNICTNQAWVALRAAMHAAWLGPSGLVESATRYVEGTRDLEERLDRIEGVTAPIHDGTHFREFTWQVEGEANRVATDLLDNGFAVHALDADTLQVCVTDQPGAVIDGFVETVEEVVA